MDRIQIYERRGKFRDFATKYDMPCFQEGEEGLFDAWVASYPTKMLPVPEITVLPVPMPVNDSTKRIEDEAERIYKRRVDMSGIQHSEADYEIAYEIGIRYGLDQAEKQPECYRLADLFLSYRREYKEAMNVYLEHKDAYEYQSSMRKRIEDENRRRIWYMNRLSIAIEMFANELESGIKANIHKRSFPSDQGSYQTWVSIAIQYDLSLDVAWAICGNAEDTSVFHAYDSDDFFLKHGRQPRILSSAFTLKEEMSLTPGAVIPFPPIPSSSLDPPSDDRLAKVGIFLGIEDRSRIRDQNWGPIPSLEETICKSMLQGNAPPRELIEYLYELRGISTHEYFCYALRLEQLRIR